MFNKFRLPLISQCKYFIVSLLLFVSCNKDDNSIDTISEEEQKNNPEINPEDKLTLFTINTNNNAFIVDEPKTDAKLIITDNEEDTYTGNIGIEIRGSSSQLFPKKSYGLETRDEANEDLDISLLGMPPEEDWILYGPYSDKTLVRNRLIYDLSREMDRYASRNQFVELNINGNYRGVYVFMEKLKRNKDRININKLTEDENSGEDLTGGYIIKIDKNDNGGFNNQNSFNSQYGSSIDGTGNEIRFLYDYPKASKITTAQKNYIGNYINEFEAALVSENFKDPATGYQAYADIDSFVDFFILNEVSNNVDGYRISTYMHKDKNQKLKMGPIWDFNLAFGNADYCGGGETNVWAYKFNERCPGDGLSVPFWWSRLLEDPTFVERLKDRWSTLRGGALSDTMILDKVDGYTQMLQDAGAIKSNFDTWPVFDIYVWPNQFIGSNYNDEIGYLKQWISNRTQWLDTAINTL